MAIIAQRNTIRKSEHLAKQVGDCLDMMGMASGLSALNTFTIIQGKNVFCPILHSLGSANISSDESHPTFPEVIIRATSVQRQPFIATFPRTILSSLCQAWDNLKFFATRYTSQGNFVTAVGIMANPRAKVSHPMLGRFYTKHLVAMQTSFPSTIYFVCMKTISRTVGSLGCLGRKAIKSLTTAWTNLWVCRDTHINYIITINKTCQVKQGEFGERYTETQANSEPSQRYISGRCRDYWRGLVPLITSESALPRKGEDIVQSSEKSETRCTETESTITINNYYYAAYALEDVIKPMVEVGKISKYLPKLGYALGLQEDDDLAALVDDGTITQSVGTLATGLTYDNLVRGDQYLNDANAPQENRGIIISPAEKANFLKMDQFINKDYQDIRTGILGSWMNYPIFVTTNADGTNAAGHDNFMFQKECIAHVSQIQPIVKSFWDIDYFCAKLAALTTYGSTIRRADHGVWMKGA